jgi:hypothetical protein
VSGSPVHTRPLLVSADDWSVLARASLAGPLVLGSSGGFAAGLARSHWFVSAGPALARTSLAGLLVLGSSGGFAAGFVQSHWPVSAGPALAHTSLKGQLFLGSSGGFAAGLAQSLWLVSAGPALARTPQSSRGYAAGLVCRSPPSTSRCLRFVFARVNSTGIRLLSSSSTLVAV